MTCGEVLCGGCGRGEASQLARAAPDAQQLSSLDAVVPPGRRVARGASARGGREVTPLLVESAGSCQVRSLPLGAELEAAPRGLLGLVCY